MYTRSDLIRQINGQYFCEPNSVIAIEVYSASGLGSSSELNNFYLMDIWKFEHFNIWKFENLNIRIFEHFQPVLNM